MDMSLAVSEQEYRMSFVVFFGGQAFVIKALDDAGALFCGLYDARQLDNLTQRESVSGVTLHGGRHIGNSVGDSVVLCWRLGQCAAGVQLDFDAAVRLGFNLI